MLTHMSPPNHFHTLMCHRDAVGDLELDRLPGPEALLVPGERSGQNLMIRKEVHFNAFFFLLLLFYFLCLMWSTNAWRPAYFIGKGLYV